MNFFPYPFERLNELINDIIPTKETCKLTIGEPQFETPQFIQEKLAQNTQLLNRYPASGGESYLKDSMLDYVCNRFGVSLTRDEIVPTFGTREVLFNFPCFYLSDKAQKTMAFPNPFYQIYEGAAIASGAKIIYMNLDSTNDFKPHLDENSLKEVDLVILNSPNNPTGAVLSKDELALWVELALKYDFVLINDECYSDIYEEIPPSSILEASLIASNAKFHNVLAINSISKRSSAPGLRSGFIAGDSKILERYRRYRTYIGCASPLPLQIASSVAWRDSKSSESFRQKYAINLKLAREILNVDVNPYTFYVWLKVGDDIAFTTNLYKNEGILVLPGRFLGRNSIGEGYVRIALVYEKNIIINALERIKNWI